MTSKFKMIKGYALSASDKIFNNVKAQYLAGLDEAMLQNNLQKIMEE